MENYFKKFNLELKEFNYEQLKGNLAFQYGYPDVTIFLYWVSDINLFRSLHKSPIGTIRPDRVFYAEIIGKGFLQPHLDLGVGCNLNWYFQTDESSTLFYKQTDATKLSNFGEQGENVFYLEELTEVCKFKAEKNDAYLLNVSEVHSVFKPNYNIRKFFSYQWLNQSYETIVNTLTLS
jgi:hypothetical protein